jgi:hypothetical protein
MGILAARYLVVAIPPPDGSSSRVFALCQLPANVREVASRVAIAGTAPRHLGKFLFSKCETPLGEKHLAKHQVGLTPTSGPHGIPGERKGSFEISRS